MAKAGRPSSGKGKLLTVRLTPKMRYSVELLARIQRRNSITAVIELALERLLHDKEMGLTNGKGEYLPDLIFDEDEVTCFVNLCLHCSELLTYDEELIWRVIEADKKTYWKAHRTPNYEKIKADWDAINEQAINARH